MRGAIAVRRFELQHDVTGPSAAKAFVTQGRTGDVATETFEFLPLMGPTASVATSAEVAPRRAGSRHSA